MDTEKKFEAAKVSSLATEIEQMTRKVEELREQHNRADSALRRAETALSNKKSEFTRAVESQLDHMSLAAVPLVRAVRGCVP